MIPSTLDLSRLSETYGDDVKRTLERTATEVASMSPETFVASLSPLLRQLAKSHGLKFSAYMQLLRSTISGLKVSENENIYFTKIVRIISSSSAEFALRHATTLHLIWSWTSRESTFSRPMRVDTVFCREEPSRPS